MEIIEAAKEGGMAIAALVVVYLLMRPLSARLPDALDRFTEAMRELSASFQSHDTRQTEQHTQFGDRMRELSDRINGRAP